jgi:hypothetical protein
MRLAAARVKEVERSVDARDEAVETGADKDRHLHRRARMPGHATGAPI